MTVDQGRFFGLFHTYIIHFGDKVHVGTLGPFWGTVGGQKWPKLGLNSIQNKKKNKPNLHMISILC